MTNTLDTTVAPTSAPTVTPAPARTLGIVALVLGILSIVSGMNVLIGAGAIVVAVLALRQETASRGLAIGGLVTGAISVASITFGFGAALAALPFFGLAAFWGW